MKQAILCILALAALCCCSPKASGAGEGPVVAVLGDSNSWLGGDDCSGPKGWTSHFKALCKGSSMRSFARSGATWSHTSATRLDTLEYSEIITDCNVLLNQTERLRGSGLQPDVILAMAGPNDAWFSERRPGILTAPSLPDSLLTTAPPGEVISLRDAVRLNFRRLREAFPGAALVAVLSSQSTKFPNERLFEINDIIREAAEAEGATVVRLDTEGPIRVSEEALKPRLTYDGIHTSEEGAEAVARFIYDKLHADGIL